MKKLFTTLLLSVFAVFQLSAEDNSRLENLTVFNPNSNWELIKEENGIKVYVSNYEWVDGALKLRLKFENTISNDVTIKFEVQNSNTDMTVRNYELKVKANSSAEFKDEKSPIEIGVGQTEKDFTINFK